MKKIILYTIIAFLSLVTIIITYTGFVFDPDDYREEITEYISDKINYDFDKKKYHISMFDKKKVNIKIIQ